MFEIKVELTRCNSKQYESDKITVKTEVGSSSEIFSSVESIKLALGGEIKSTPVKEIKAVEKVEVTVEEVSKTIEKTVKDSKKKEKVKVKAKATPYDRKLDTHKKMLGDFLNAEAPDWKEPKNLPKAAEVSTSMVGADFLDGDGNMLESFKEAFLKGLKGW